jgi:polysaccharide export outer membrane protein
MTGSVLNVPVYLRAWQAKWSCWLALLACAGSTCAVLLALPGCAGNPSHYDASSLPDDFRAFPEPSYGEVDLKRFAVPRRDTARIGSGDLLEMTLASGYESDHVVPMLVRVDESGSISIPLVGTVEVGGLTPTEAEQTIVGLAMERGLYRQPYVTLSVKRAQSNLVTVLGAVNTPGTHELPHGASDLLGALAAAGGMAEEAGLEIEILRKPEASGPELLGSGHGESVAGSLTGYSPPPMGGPPLAGAEAVDLPSSAAGWSAPRVERIHLADAASGAVDYRLADGDIVMVYPRKPRVVHVMGLVRKPDQIEVEPGKDIHLLDALALAGGRTMELADRVHVIRRIEGLPEPIVIQVSVRQAKQDPQANIRLAAGDLVSVEETPFTFLLQSLQSFFRFGFSMSTPLL